MSALRTTYQRSKGQNACMQHQVIEPFSVHTPVASAWLLEKQCHPAAAQSSMRHPRHQVIEPFFSSTLIISVVTQSRDFIMRMHRRARQWPGKIKEETSLLKSTRSNRWPCAWKSHSSLSETERLDAASGNRTILSLHYVASEWLLEKQCHPAAVRPRNRMLVTPTTSGHRTILRVHTAHQHGYLKQKLHHADAQTYLAPARQDKGTARSTSIQEANAGLVPGKAHQAST